MPPTTPVRLTALMLLLSCTPDTEETDTDTSVETDDPCPADDPRRRTFHRDADGDGFGDPASPIEACVEPEGFTRSATDCDDADSTSFPGAPEACDGADNDCDERADEGLIGTGQACPAVSCRVITDDRDLDPSLAEQRFWLLDGEEAFEATCIVVSRTEAWTVITLRDAAERGWITAERLQGPGEAPVHRVTTDGRIELKVDAPFDSTRCEVDVLRATLRTPFPFAAVRGTFDARFDGSDLNRGGWGTPDRESPTLCDASALFGVPDGALLKPGGTWENGDGNVITERFDTAVQNEGDPATTALAWELHGLRRPISGDSGDVSLHVDAARFELR